MSTTKRLFKAFEVIYFAFEHRHETDLHCRTLLALLNSCEGKRTMSRRELMRLLWCDNQILDNTLESLVHEYELITYKRVDSGIIEMEVRWETVETTLGLRIPRRNRQRPEWEVKAEKIFRDAQAKVEKLKKEAVEKGSEKE